jgi:hypothetical protein
VVFELSAMTKLMVFRLEYRLALRSHPHAEAVAIALRRAREPLPF